MTDNNSIPDSALPPSAAPDYVKQMIARAEQGGSDFGNARPQPGFSPPLALQFQTKAGFSRAAAAATPDDILVMDHGGQQITVQVSEAVKAGLIKPAAGGGYEPISTVERHMAEKAQREELQQEELQASAEIEEKRKTGDEPDLAHQTNVDRLNATVPPQVANAFVDDYIRTGSISLKQVHGAARSIGIEAEAAEGLSMDLYEGYRRQADLAVSTQGVPPHEAEAFYAWASQSHPVDVRNAVRALVVASDARPFKDLARKYAALKRGGDA